jgi:hypothetical protein
VGAAVDRGAREPLVDGVLEGGLVAEAGLHAVVRGGGLAALTLQGFHEALLLAEGDARRVVEAEDHLDLADLRGLEAARGDELIAELEVVARGEGLDDAEVVDGLLEDGADALEGAQRRRRAGRRARGSAGRRRAR